MRRGIMTATALGLLAAGLSWAGAAPDRNTPDPPPNPDCSPAPSGHPPVVRSQPRASLTPSSHHIVVKYGRPATVHLSIVQPAQELDAFFLEDNGTRSEFTHCAVQGGLLWATSRLATERNLRVGLGNFGDYSGYEQKSLLDASGFDAAQGYNGVYFLDTPVRRPDQTFFTDVIDLGSAWEGGWHATSGDQADLEALYQAVTGAGQIIAPAHPDNIAAGQGAGFHADAFPVVVMMAATWFDTAARTPAYPGADFATVTAALRARGVNLAGVWLDNSNNKEENTGSSYDGRADLRDLVTSGGARTARPLSCGRSQSVPAGGLPMCVFVPPADLSSNPGGSAEPHQMGPMLRNLVDSLANPQPVALDVIDGGGVVSAVAGGEHPGVDILQAHTLGSTVTFRCPAKLAGHTVHVTLGERVAGQPRADTQIAVTCQRPPGKPARPLAVLLAAPGLAGLGPGEPPGQAPGTQLQFNPNPAPNTVAGAVAVHQEQDEQQVAFAYHDDEAGLETLAMSRRTGNSADELLFAGSALTLFGASTAVATRRRWAHSWTR